MLSETSRKDRAGSLRLGLGWSQCMPKDITINPIDFYRHLIAQWEPATHEGIQKFFG